MDLTFGDRVESKAKVNYSQGIVQDIKDELFFIRWDNKKESWESRNALSIILTSDEIESNRLKNLEKAGKKIQIIRYLAESLESINKALSQDCTVIPFKQYQTIHKLREDIETLSVELLNEKS